MLGYFRRLTIRNIVSPYGLALFSYAVFLFGWVFPPDVYTSYIREPDLMFLDPLTFAFFTSCVAAFLFGVRVSRYMGLTGRQVPEQKISTGKPAIFLIMPILVAAAFCAIYLILLGGKLNFIALLASQQGNVIKEAGMSGGLTVEGRWSMSPLFLTSVLWWAEYRVSQFRIRGGAKVAYRVIFMIALLLDVVTCVAQVNRSSLMPLLAGLLLIYLYRKAGAANAKVSSIVGVGGGSFIVVTAMFSLLSFLRGASGLKLLMFAIIGYTITSYNRLAAILTGTMHYAYGGRGAYLVTYLQSDNWLSSLLGVHSSLKWPAKQDLWLSEFTSTAGAGLNPAFIWSGAFGYLYTDIGWWSLWYLFMAGVLASYLWNGFRKGKAVSVVMYLWLAFWILFWLGSNLLLDYRATHILLGGAVLTVYEFLFARRLLADRGSPLINDSRMTLREDLGVTSGERVS